MGYQLLLVINFWGGFARRGCKAFLWAFCEIFFFFFGGGVGQAKPKGFMWAIIL
jgi:hypothetical protein